MRIKRQRRKLRGKYSGNCLSCSAKWSKCWYIASVDNQREWEARLSKIVTPCADEVCFQCWDAKIRTSPKRKIHCKAELPVAGGPVSPDPPDMYTAKHADRNKRRALNGDFEYTIHTSDFTTLKGAAKTFDGVKDESLYRQYISNGGHTESTSIIFDEENAVVLLSSAFHTIPYITDVNIINTCHNVSDLEDSCIQDFWSVEDTSKRRGAYYCGRCGKLKKGHVCDALSPTLEECTQTLGTLSLPQLTIAPTPQVVDGGALAQPVVS